MAEKQFDLIACGEALVEFNLIEGPPYYPDVAGDAINSLYYAARLGLRTSFLSAVGEDRLLPFVEAALTEEGIDGSCVYIFEERPNGIYFVDAKQDGSHTFRFCREGTAATQLFTELSSEDVTQIIDSSEAFLFSAIPMAVMVESSRLAHAVCDYRGDTLVGFDLNIRKSLWPKLDQLQSWMRMLGEGVEYLFVSSEDHETLYPNVPLDQAIEHYADLGFGTVVLRHGGDSTEYFDDGRIGQVPTASVTVLDTTGAGDAFNAGFFKARLEGASVQDSVAYGNATAACAVEGIGGRAKQFSRNRVEELLMSINEARDV